MKKIVMQSPAKLNLSLNLLPDRGKMGYYRVLFLNTQIALYDTVRISMTAQKTVRINEIKIDNASNIAYRAARLMLDRYSLPYGVMVEVEKRIPLRAGLGGGSSDAASVINGIDRLFGLELTGEEKLSLAGQLGMDVCYCVIGGLCRIEGIGDVVERTGCRLPEIDILIATPKVRKPSTSWAYSILDEHRIGRSTEKFALLLDGIARRDLEAIARNLHNDFERPMAFHYPLIESVAGRMRRQGSLATLLAGSGLSVFGIFQTADAARRAAKALESEDLQCFPTRTLS